METTVIASDGTYRADAYRSLVAKASDPAGGGEDGAYTVLAAYGATPAAPAPLLAALLADVDAPEAADVDAAAVAAAAAALSPTTAAAGAAAGAPASAAAVTGGVAAVDDSSVLASPARGVVGLSVPPPPSTSAAAPTASDTAAAAAAARSAVWAATVADGLLWVVRAPDLRRPVASGLSSLLSAVAASLRVRSKVAAAASGAGQGAGKRLLLVAVMDLDLDETPREALVAAALAELAAAWGSTPRPAGFASTRLTDLYQLEFVTFPHRLHSASSYADSVVTLRGRLTDPAAEAYLFPPASRPPPYAAAAVGADSADMYASSVWGALEEDGAGVEAAPSKAAASGADGADGGPVDAAAARVDDGEAKAAYRLDQLRVAAYEQYSANAADWKDVVDGGALVDDFSAAADALRHHTLTAFDEDAAAYASSATFARKRAELDDAVVADLRALYDKQVATARERAYDRFRAAAAAIPPGADGVSRRVTAAVKEAESAFRDSVAELTPAGAADDSWRPDATTEALKVSLREDAAERLQLAKLHAARRNRAGRRGGRGGGGAGGGGTERQPIAVSFHYLAPSVFGLKDSRVDRLSAADSVAYQAKPGPDMALGSLRPAGAASGGGGLLGRVFGRKGAATAARPDLDLIYTDTKAGSS